MKRMYGLQTTGSIDEWDIGKFSFKWFDKIEPKKIISVEILIISLKN